MKQLYSFLFFLVFTTIIFANEIGFAKNIGQIVDQNNIKNKSIIYNLRLENFNINLKRNGFNYDFYELNKKKIKTHRIEFLFKNNNPNYKILHQDKINYFENFIDGSNDYKIEFYSKIIYKDFYPNIDLEFYVNDDQSKPFEYNFVLHPGADINQIKFEIKGAKTKLNSNTLNFKLRFGELSESLPKSWIEEKRKSKPIDVEYCYHNDGSIGLQTNQSIKNSKVIIDPLPIRKWGSYFSKFTFNGYPIDNHFMEFSRVKFYNSEIYVFGTTSQKNLATSGAFQTTIINTYQPFIARFNKNGQRIWFTYFGSGGNTEYAGEMDVDNLGNIYVGYNVYGKGFATPGAYQEQKDNYGDMIIAKFNSEGKRLWATYYGGNVNDGFSAIKVDKINNLLYFGGDTSSSNLVHPSDAIIKENAFGNGVGVLVKFDLDGNYIWSSFMPQQIRKISIDNEGNLIFSGVKISSYDIRTPEFKNTIGNNSISKYTPDMKLIWSKNFLDSNYGYIENIAIDSENNIILAGATYPAIALSFGNSYSPNYNFEDYKDMAGFLTKLDTKGNDIFSTYVGDKGFTYVTDLAVGNNDEILISGNATNEEKIIFGKNHFQSNFYNLPMIDLNGNALLMKFDKLGNPIWGFLSGCRLPLFRTPLNSINNFYYD